MDPAPERRRLLHDGGRWKVAGRQVQAQPGSLGDLPVLAEGAVEGAARRGDGIGRRAGSDVEERLLLDGVQAHGDDLAVGQADQVAAAVLADAADPRPARAHQAAMGAHAAADGPIGLRLREDRGDRIGSKGVKARIIGSWREV